MVAPGDGPKVQDALGYLEEVKQTFSEKTEVYDEFLEIMKEFKSHSLNTDGVILRVKTLFDGHPSLILGFNQFLPEGYEIQLEEPPKPHMEFNQAVTYVAKIKQRFEHNPSTYEEFLDILHEFQAKQKKFDQMGDRAGMDQAILEVKGRVHDLFNGQEDLLQEFSFFLPDNCRTGDQMDMAPDGQQPGGGAGGGPSGGGGGGGAPGGDAGGAGSAGGIGAQQQSDAQGDATSAHHQQGFAAQHAQQQNAATGSDEDQYATAAAVANDRRTRRGGYRGSAAAQQQQPMADSHHQPGTAVAAATVNDRRGGGGGNDMMDNGGVGAGGRSGGGNDRDSENGSGRPSGVSGDSDREAQGDATKK